MKVPLLLETEHALFQRGSVNSPQYYVTCLIDVSRVRAEHGRAKRKEHSLGRQYFPDSDKHVGPN